MHDSSCFLALLLVTVIGCGARNHLDLASSEGGHGGVCSERQPAALVPDCTRTTPSAIPIARLAKDPAGDDFSSVDEFHLATDGESLYYVSEGRVFRLSMTDWVSEALTPPGSAGSGVTYADGFIYWKSAGAVQRVPAWGGPVEPLAEVPPSAYWAVAGDAILSAGPANLPSPLYRTSLTTGETTEFIANDPDQFIRGIRVDGDRVLVAYSQGLVTVPTIGGDVEVLASISMSGAEPPIADEAHIYFGARMGSTLGLYRIPRDEPSEPELFLPGFPVSVALTGDDVFANVVPNLEMGEKETIGELLRAPVSGEAPEHITFTDARRTPSYISHKTAGLVASDCTLYFIEFCADDPIDEYRLVALPRPGVE